MAFEKESVASNYSCITSFTSPHSPQQNETPPAPHSPQQNGTPPSKISNGNTCYSCKKPGHWYKDCPDKTSKKSAEPRSLPRVMGIDGWQYQPCVICSCGGVCVIKISKSESNPGREYWGCSICRQFVRWVDNGKTYQIINVPLCGCQAGPCRVFTERIGANAGLRFYVCHIKKGQGACDFRRPVDAQVTTVNGCEDEKISSPPSTFTNCDDTSPASSELVDEGECSHKVEIESPAMHTTQCPPSHGATSGHPKRGKIVDRESEGEEDTSNEPPRKLHKRLRHGAAKIDCTYPDFANEWGDMSEIDCKETEFMSQISIERLPATPASASVSASAYSLSFSFRSNLVPSGEDCLVTTATCQNLGFRVHDWWGRIGFPPSRCLTMPAPKPFFCCFFPSFDPISVPRNVDPFDGEASSILPLSLLTTENNEVPPISIGQDAQLSSFVHWDTSRLEWLPEREQGSVMKNVVYKGFAQLAMHLQKELLMVLESKDFHDHESMVNEAITTFAALDQLSSIDSQPFCKRVRAFITCASSLSEIELRIKNDQLSQELIDRYNHEKKRLDEISSEHAKAMAGLEASRQRLLSLDEKASDLRKILFEIEAEISGCKVENWKLESRFVEISKEKVELERGFLVVSVAAQDALKLCDRREEDRRVAQAAFEKAKLLLRQ